MLDMSETPIHKRKQKTDPKNFSNGSTRDEPFVRLPTHPFLNKPLKTLSNPPQRLLLVLISNLGLSVLFQTLN